MTCNIIILVLVYHGEVLYWIMVVMLTLQLVHMTDLREILGHISYGFKPPSPCDMFSCHKIFPILIFLKMFCTWVLYSLARSFSLPLSRSQFTPTETDISKDKIVLLPPYVLWVS